MWCKSWNCYTLRHTLNFLRRFVTSIPGGGSGVKSSCIDESEPSISSCSSSRLSVDSLEEGHTAP